MIVLALDTALDACSVAVTQDGDPLAVRSEPMTRGHQERLAPLVAEAMADAKLDFQAVDRLAVVKGPGSFTGLRVGLAFAKTMALALERSCVGIGALEALVASAPSVADAPLAIAALDARRGHVYVQAFTRGAPVMEACNLSIHEAQARLEALGAGPATPAAGSGVALLWDRDVSPGSASEGIDPLAVARLAALRPADGRVEPLYLRAPDARTIAERIAMKAG